MLKTVLALALAASISPAMAQTHTESPPLPQCIQVEDALNALKDKYGEMPVLVGKTKSPEIRLIVTGTPDGKSWTIMIVKPDGFACPIATGTDMHEVKSAAPGKDI